MWGLISSGLISPLSLSLFLTFTCLHVSTHLHLSVIDCIPRLFLLPDRPNNRPVPESRERRCSCNSLFSSHVQQLFHLEKPDSALSECFARKGSRQLWNVTAQAVGGLVWHTHTHTHTYTHTHTHTHVGLYGLRGLSIGVMVFILYKLYVLLPYTYPTPKLSPHRRRCISTFPPKNSLCMIYKHFKLRGHWKCPHKSPSPCNTYVIPMSLYKFVSS